MTNDEFQLSLRRLYWLTAFFGAAGFVSYFWVRGLQPALSFGLGAVGSFGNLWLFSWLSNAISPGAHARKPWKAGLFAGRYAVLLLLGYVIVKALKVNGLAVILGLLASAAAVLASLTFEIVQSTARGISR